MKLFFIALTDTYLIKAFLEVVVAEFNVYLRETIELLLLISGFLVPILYLSRDLLIHFFSGVLEALLWLRH
jgi:hypothetical protein